MASEHFDYLIIGGGLSGVGAAVYYRKLYPGANKPDSGLEGSNKRFVICESRPSVGGTWDLFRYPGIRSDSRMSTFAFSFKPWTDFANSICPGGLIKQYIEETAAEYEVSPYIRTGMRAKKMNWDSKELKWFVTFDKVELGEDGQKKGEAQEVVYSCNFLQMCTGYYDFEKGYTPTEGAWATLKEDFKGTVIHPQSWPDKFNYDGKKVVVIGSGATAITLVPAMADRASHITMLQRSPTWMISLSSAIRVPFYLKWLPKKCVARATRYFDIFIGWAQFVYCRAFPNAVGSMLRSLLQKQEGLSKDDVAKNFTPAYKIWDERFCVVANGDLFAKLREKKADVVTGSIEKFVANGIQLKPEGPGSEGRVLEADIIVTATGLNVQLFGGAVLEMDGVPVDIGSHIIYRGTMLSGIPNMAIAIGYTNASWTLKVELSFQYLMRLFKYMDDHKKTVVTPTPNPTVGTTKRSVFDLQSNYVKRALALLPVQGTKAPWIVFHSYPRDVLQIGYGSCTEDMVYN